MRKLERVRGQYENKHRMIYVKNLVEEREMRTHDFKSDLFIWITVNKNVFKLDFS